MCPPIDRFTSSLADRSRVGASLDQGGPATVYRAPDLRASAQRDAEIQAMVRRNDRHAAVACTHWPIDDAVVTAVLERTSSYGRGPTPGLLMGAILLTATAR